MALDLGAAGARAADRSAAGTRAAEPAVERAFVQPPDDDTTDDGPDDRAPAVDDRLRWVLPLVLVLFAGVLRFAYLPHPDRIYFDETYYATNAAQLLDYGVEAEPAVAGNPSAGVDPVFVVHPPVGKWLIAAGIAVFGDNSLGWRFSSAAAGTALVGVTYAIAMRLFRRRGVAALTGFLLSIEGLALTMSRISMLDVFLALFVALGVWALLIDRDLRWALVSGPRPGGERHRLPDMPRTFVWLAGLAFGLALATKASAMLAITAAGVFLLASEVAWRRAVTGRWHAQPWRLVGLGLTALLVVPAAVYVASYVSWFANYEHTRPGVAACAEQPCDVGPVDMARGWFGEQQDIYRFHRDLEVTHSYRASAALWPITWRPVVYYYEPCLDEGDRSGGCQVPEDTLEEIIGLGNPAIWWATLPVYPWLLWAAVRRRDRIAATIAVFLFVQYLPWLVQSRPLFYFYALPIVPFVVVALGWAAAKLLPRPGLRWVPIGVATTALVAFVFWSPVYYGVAISERAWRMRMWFDGWI
jgi:dolichyl-phosphate-mannose--protein O-mannosyl transferase